MAKKNQLDDKVIYINRVSKAVAGGSTFSFSTMVAVGDNDGSVGIGIGQADEVVPSIQKGKAAAEKNMIKVPRLNTTIPHEIEAKHDGARVFLKPAHPGTGVIAGGAVRAVVELAGINDILSKSLGSDNSLNIARATIKALQNLRDPHLVANLRGKTLDEILSDNPYGGPDKAPEEESEQEPADPADEDAPVESTGDEESEDAAEQIDDEEEVSPVETT